MIGVKVTVVATVESMESVEVHNMENKRQAVWDGRMRNLKHL